MYQALEGWMPDADLTTPGALLDVTDMIPVRNGMAGARTGVQNAVPALAAQCRGAAYVVRPDGSPYLFAGTQTKLYWLNGAAWEEVTRTSGGDYTGSTTSRWRFVIQGDVVMTVNKEDTPQTWDLTSGTDFANLTAMPKAACIEVAGAFVMLADTNEATYSNSYDRWWCSAINDYTDWTPDVATQCTTGRLVDTPGRIVSIKKLGEYVVAYKRASSLRSMYVGRYVGTPEVWNFTLVSSFVGAPSDESVVKVGGYTHLFPGPDNFYSFDGATLTPIGNDVKEWYYSAVNTEYDYLVTGLHDWRDGLVYWFYPASASTTLDSWVCYNYRTGKWGKGTLNTEAATDFIQQLETYANLASAYSTYADIPSVPYDTLSGTGGMRLPAYFGTDHRVYTLTGNTETCSFSTGWFGADGVYSLIYRIRNRYRQIPDSAELMHYRADQLSDTAELSATVTEENGKFDFCSSGRWHKITQEFSGPVTITGMDVSIQKDGDE